MGNNNPLDFGSTSVNQTRNATINDIGNISFDLNDPVISSIRGWGPDYFGSTPATAEMKFKCNLLVDFMYFYNLVPLHGDEHVINSKTDSSKVVMVFCDPMNSTTLTKYGCDPTLQTMVVFVDKDKNCHRLSGPDMNTQANYEVQDP